MTTEEAIKEMKERGFGYHTVWFNLPTWLDSLDLASIRSEAGILLGPPLPTP
jgi:hypothetical protein